MSAQDLLSRLERVRQSGRGRWTALCPAHGDRLPSLSIRELDDGRVLLRCFAGCSVESVLQAVGLGFESLFPERRVGDRAAREPRPYRASELVAALRFELTVALVLLSALHQGRPLDQSDRERAGLALDRLLTFLELLDHAR